MPMPSSIELVEIRRCFREQRGLLRLAILRTEPLEGVENYLIAALALVRREIAFEHRAIGPKGLDAGLDIGPPRRRSFFRGGRFGPQVIVIAEQAHRKPAEFDDDIGAFGDFLDRGFPDRKDFLAPAGIAASADRAATMIEYDFGVRKGAGEVGEFTYLGMKQPGIEAQAQRREAGKALAKGRVEQKALRPRCIDSGDVGVGIPRGRMPYAAKPAVAGDHL